MSSYCLSNLCLNGNCPGCKNGVQFCEDPRCFPNCPNCVTSGPTSTSSSVNNSWGWWVYLIIIIVILILLVFLFLALRNRKPICPLQNIRTQNRTQPIPKQMVTETVYQPVPQEIRTELPVEAMLAVPIEDTKPVYQRPFDYESERATMELDRSLDVPSPMPIPEVPFIAEVPPISDIQPINRLSEFPEMPKIPVLPELTSVPDFPSLDTSFETDSIELLRSEAVLEPTVSLSPTPIVQRSSKILYNIPRATLPPPEKLTVIPSSSSTIRSSNLKSSLLNDDTIKGF